MDGRDRSGRRTAKTTVRASTSCTRLRRPGAGSEVLHVFLRCFEDDNLLV